MVSTIEKDIIVKLQDAPRGSHRQYLGRKYLQIIDDVAAEELAGIHEKQRRRNEEDKDTKIWTLQGLTQNPVPLSSMTSSYNVLPFTSFSTKKTMLLVQKKLVLLASFGGIVCKQEFLS